MSAHDDFFAEVTTGPVGERAFASDTGRRWDYRKVLRGLARPSPTPAPAALRRTHAPAPPRQLTDLEKRAFVDAADLAGLSLSSWVRERLRRAARAELNEAGKPVAFLPSDGTTKGQG
jgi:hypothetical protein